MEAGTYAGPGLGLECLPEQNSQPQLVPGTQKRFRAFQGTPNGPPEAQGQGRGLLA